MSKFDIADLSDSNDIISINGYEIIERIGVGSYGRVYKVSKNKKYYVLKEIPLNLSSAAEKINSVQNEADILSSLDNKYVVKFYKSFKKNQNIYIIMEYCDNGDLCTFLSRMKKHRINDTYFLSKDDVWKLFIQMSIGLYYIHSKKIIHRDIKTLNIFLTKNYDAKIGDLGVAKILDNTNHAMTFIGTPYYVSPEMCRNKPYNEKSDIWALGCILYELLTFNHPFTATNQAALFIKILNNKYNPFPPGVPDDLKSMVDFILQKDYEIRPSMEEIITSKSFQYNALRLGLDKDLKNVLGIDSLPVQNMKKELSINYSERINSERNSNEHNLKNNSNNINSSHTFIIQLNSSKKHKEGNNVNNQKSDLINSKSLNDILKKYYALNGKKEQSKNKNNQINYCLSNNSNRSYQKLIKNDYKKSKNKRTKSDFNCLEQNNTKNVYTTNTNRKTEQTTQSKKKLSNIPKTKFISFSRSNLSPKKPEKIIDTSRKIKENFEKKFIRNNFNLNGCNININIKSNDFHKNSDYIKYCETAHNKLKKNSRSKNNRIKNTYINRSPKIKNSKIITDKKTNIKNDLISEAEFISELQNTIKNTQSIITLNDLLNFNLEDSKNLNTTSATSLLDKKQRPSIGSEEKYDLVLKNVEEEIEKENLDNINNLCEEVDEFTRTERLKRSEPFLSNQIPFSNYEIKINENKKELKLINQMNKDELMQTNLKYKYQYEKYLEKIKKYKNYINIDEVKQIYKNINSIYENDIKFILNEINNYLKKKKVPKENLDDIVDIIYNIISYEIKCKYTEKAIKKVDL